MGRYEDSLEKRIKDFVAWELEHYPESKRQLEEYKRDLIPSATPAYSLSAGGHSGESRPTEKISLQILSDQYVMHKTYTVAAIERVVSKLNTDDYRLVDLVYWKGSHTVAGAAFAVHLSKSAAYRRLNAIIAAIAKEIGFVSV